MSDRVERIQFTLGPDTRTREPDSDGVTALDDALSKRGTGELLHAMDPRRIVAFSSGGPPVWSVAFVPLKQDELHVTYGFSRFIDPEMPSGFELSIRVPAARGGMWATLFLRSLARYMLTSRRELRVGDFMPFPASITRVAVNAAEAGQFPDSKMNAVAIVTDPELPFVDTPKGRLEVRRVVGLFADECDLMQCWSTAGFVSELAKRQPALVSDFARASLAKDDAFVKAIEAGSRQHGSAFGFVAVPGVRWTETERGFEVELPGGAQARRIHRMVQARLPHGKHLLVHDDDPNNPLGVAFEPSPEPGIAVDGPNLILRVGPDHPFLAAFANPAEGRIKLTLT